MTLTRFAERRFLYPQEGKPADINAMGGAVAQELAVTHDDLALGPIPGKDAVLIVHEANALHHEIAAFGADGGAIAVRHACTGQGQVAHGDVVAGDDEESLALTGLVRDHGVLGRYSLDGQIVLFPNRAVEILPRRYHYMAPILRRRCRL